MNLLCLLLLLGTKHRWCEDPIESALFIRAQASKAQGPLVLLRIFFFFFFFFFLSTVQGFLGALTCSKTLENCTHVGIRGHQDAAEAGTRAWHRGSTAPPRTQSENLMYSSHILARIHMKLGTHIDLIELNKFHTACHRLRPTGSRLSCSSKDYYYFFIFLFFSTVQGFLGALTCSKTLENSHTHWNPRPSGRRRGWDPGMAQGLYGAP